MKRRWAVDAVLQSQARRVHFALSIHFLGVEDSVEKTSTITARAAVTSNSKLRHSSGRAMGFAARVGRDTDDVLGPHAQIVQELEAK